MYRINLFSCLICHCIFLKIQVFNESVAFPFLYPELSLFLSYLFLVVLGFLCCVWAFLQMW